MQKKLIVVALAAIAAAPAFAQSNVTIYGRIDYGYVSQSGDSGGVVGTQSTQSFQSGVQAGSRIGFRGTEDLGNGLKAIFEVESGISNDEQGTAAGRSGVFSTNRHSYVGLTGNFGTVVGGRLDGVRYGIFNKYDAFGGGNVGNFTQTTIQVDRASNAIAYVSPRFSGFQVTAAYATNDGVAAARQTEAAGNTGDGRLNTLMANYENGPISLTADWETIKQVDGVGKHRVATVAGSYDFGVAKVAALWDRHRSDFGSVAGNTLDYRDYFLSASIPFAGKFTGKITWGKVDDKLAANADATKWGLGLNYALSKRTGLYADYGKIKNDNLGNIQISAAANSQRTGLGVKAFDLGIAHTF